MSELDLGHNDVGPSGAAALALPKIRLAALSLDGTGIAAEGLAQVVQAGRGLIAGLNAASNDLGPDGVRRLATVTEASSLQQLDLSQNGLGGQGIEALAQVPS